MCRISFGDVDSIALLCSGRCPGTVVVTALDLGSAIAQHRCLICSGFHSPVERECLKFLLAGTSPLVVCPARSTIGMRIPAAWKSALASGRLTIRSAFDEGVEAQHHTPEAGKVPRRQTKALAEQRNRFVAAISDAVLILHASPGGKLDRLATDLLTEGRKPVWTLDDPANHHLIAAGARPVSSDTVSKIWQTD